MCEECRVKCEGCNCSFREYKDAGGWEYWYCNRCLHKAKETNDKRFW